MTISKQLIDSDHTIDLWRLTTNEFEGWEYGKVLIASDSPDKYKVSQLWQYILVVYIIQRYYTQPFDPCLFQSLEYQKKILDRYTNNVFKLWKVRKIYEIGCLFYFSWRFLCYFVTKIVLTYCEKKLFKGLRIFFEIQGWRPRICKIFEITRTIYSNSERSEQFLVTECFFNLFLEVSHI